MKSLYLLIFIAFGFFLASTSCTPGSKIKNMTYLTDSVTDSEKIAKNNFEIKLQTGDRITILVTALNALAAQQFNVLSANAMSLGMDPSKTNGNLTQPVISDYGYLVNAEGNIQFPQLGNIQVKGLTTNEVADKIQKQLLQYLKEPTIIVNIINFRVNVLGEVNHPGTITVPDGGISILEAISEAGDLSIFGKRENVLVIRQKDGKREFGRVDLTSNQLFNSPYFYLKQGDIIYVELNKNKIILSNANEERNFRIISLILAAITAVAIVINVSK
jgi:polysaccharide biosynthesis/export protein